MAHLTTVLRTYFLTPEAAKRKTKYVAWNGNRFDAYFVAAALIREPDLVLRPYLTKNKTVRGLRVSLKYAADGSEYDERYAPSWEFLDGIAMLGLAGTSLEKLLANFCPEHGKKIGIIDFEGGQQFDPENPKHCIYAMGDSVGLYHAMTRAQSIMLENFNEPLAVTMGGVCIKVFQAHMPRDVVVNPLTHDMERIVRRHVMRGGFCYCVRQYTGPIWKYDLNQAYAAAMREARLPCGEALYGKGEPSQDSASIVHVKAFNASNVIPFYCRQEIDGRLRSTFAHKQFEAWITGIEYWQLKNEGWKLTPIEFYEWPDTFTMREYVDRLERLRMTCEGGPSGPIGTMLKATGNHSYGKTLESVEALSFVIALECPPDCLPYYSEGREEISHVFYRFDEDRTPKPYHQPHIGAMITAHVRMVVRRAALCAPHAWIYADTDCVVFTEDVSRHLDIDSKRYGAWKIEEEGQRYRMIAKKVYVQVEGPDGMAGPPNPKLKRSAKGLNVKRLTAEDFAQWAEGNEPVQMQTQLNNFLAVLCGEEMYRSQRRKGTAVSAPKRAAAAAAGETS